jgi:hypothetical protein
MNMRAADLAVSRHRMFGSLAVTHSVVILLFWLFGQRVGLGERPWLLLSSQRPASLRF